VDPASVTLAIGAASKAFSMLKRGFEIGRDIESMHGDIQKWMGASAQIAARFLLLSALAVAFCSFSQCT
jgi:hypothetical protein